CNALIDRVQPEQHSIYAILDVEIGFALLAVAENVQFFRVLCKLHHEIENMSVAVALPEDRYEAKNAGPDAVAFGVGSDHSLAGQLRGAVKRSLHRKGCVFRCGYDIRLAIDRTGR